MARHRPCAPAALPCKKAQAGEEGDRDALAPIGRALRRRCTARPPNVPRSVGKTCEQGGGFWSAGIVGRAQGVKWASAALTSCQGVARAHEGTLAACLEEAPRIRAPWADAKVAPCHLSGLRGGRRALLPNQRRATAQLLKRA